MKTIDTFFPTEIIEAFGWTIVHSLWQVAIVTVVVGILLVLMRNFSAQVKYVLAYASLITILSWSGITFYKAYNYALEKKELAKNIIAQPGYFSQLIKSGVHVAETPVAGETTSTFEFDFNTVKIRAFFQRNFDIILLVWMFGMLIFLFRLTGGFIYSYKLRTQKRFALPDEWHEKLNLIAQKMGFKRFVNAYQSALAKSPMALGFVKPVILFPVTMFTGFDSKQIEAIIAHELAHIYRNDYFFNILQKIIEILFFYHPGVYVLSSIVNSERENSCDNMAIEAIGDKVSYAKALVTYQEYIYGNTQLAMNFASHRGGLLNRIKRIQTLTVMKTNFIEGIIAALIIIVGLTFMSFRYEGQFDARLLLVENETFTMNENQDALEAIPEPVWTLEKRDSVKKEIEKTLSEREEELEDVSEEIEQAMEVALSESGEVSQEVLKEVQKALNDLDIDEIVKEAMEEAREAIKEAHEDIDYDEIHRDMEEARRDIEEARREIREDMREDWDDMDEFEREVAESAAKAAELGLDVAASVIENLDLEKIISISLEAASAAMEIAGEAMEETRESMNDIDLDREMSREQIERKLELQERERERVIRQHEIEIEHKIRNHEIEQERKLRELEIEKERLERELEHERRLHEMKMKKLEQELQEKNKKKDKKKDKKKSKLDKEEKDI